MLRAAGAEIGRGYLLSRISIVLREAHTTKPLAIDNVVSTSLLRAFLVHRQVAGIAAEEYCLLVVALKGVT